MVIAASIGIIGDLTCVSVPNLITMFVLSGANGRLTVEHGDDEAVLHFRAGQLQHVTSSWTQRRLGQLLIEQGKLRSEQLARALEVQRSVVPGLQLGSILIQHGAITSAELVAVLTDQAAETLSVALSWPAGQFYYVPEQPDDTVMPALALNIDWILLNSIRLVDERMSAELVPLLIGSSRR